MTPHVRPSTVGWLVDQSVGLSVMISISLSVYGYISLAPKSGGGVVGLSIPLSINRLKHIILFIIRRISLWGGGVIKEK